MTLSLLDLIFILLVFGAFFIGAVTSVMLVIKSECERRGITYRDDEKQGGERNEKG